MPLCDLPPALSAVACEPPPPLRAAPIRPSNPPNLQAIQYRIGTFSSFRRAMLDDLVLFLDGWKEASGQDYATTLVELWAYVADVLTFYQERIANEAYLLTATQPDSVRRLVELIGYRPSPGAAASTLLAFIVARGKTVNVRSSMRTSSKPAPGRPAAVFETDQAVVARSEHNLIPLASTVPANQFADPTAIHDLLYSSPPLDPNLYARELAEVFPDYAAALLGGPAPALPPPTVPKGIVAAMPDPANAILRTVRFSGTDRGLKSGAYLLIHDQLDVLGRPTGNGQLRQVTAARMDRASGFTEVTWLEDRSYRYATASPYVYKFAVQAAPFGINAPVTEPDSYLPEESDTELLYLDRAYDGIASGSRAAPSFAVLVDLELTGRLYQSLPIRSVDKVNHSNYKLNATVTRLQLEAGIAAPGGGTFKRQRTLVLAQSQQLRLFDQRPLPEPTGGSRLLLQGAFPELVPGRWVVVSGEALDAKSLPAGPAIESVLIDHVQLLSAGTDSVTELTLSSPLATTYLRSTTTVRANVVPASHGETVRLEILGSGNGLPWQDFAVRKAPVTYLQASGGDRPVSTTLEVMVDGVRWTEVDTLGSAQPGARVYTISQDLAAHSTVHFGDNSARPPTGKDNLRASYRRGLGSGGAVDAGKITTLLDTLPGLAAVTNPEATAGAADPEAPDRIKVNAPASVRTFGRAVSINDYTNLALSFPGIAMARAGWVRHQAGRSLPRPEIQLTVAASGRKAVPASLVAQLRAYLDLHRDVNVPMRLVNYTPVYIDVTAVVDVDQRYGRRATVNAVTAALSPTPNSDGGLGLFATLDFGQPVFLSAVYAVIQSVPGISGARISDLRRPGDPPGTLLETVPVRPTELAVIGNDPADIPGVKGKLVVSLGQGGYED